MGVCKFCGKPAGLFFSKHSVCKKKNQTGKQLVLAAVYSSILEGSDFGKAEDYIQRIQCNNFLSQTQIKKLLLQSFQKALSFFLSDKILDDIEEKTLTSFVKHFNLDSEDCIELRKAKIIKSLLEGKKPEIFKSFRTPFRLQKSEYMIWIYDNVMYALFKNKTHYKGGHPGMSIRIAKGVYIRERSFKGYPVKREELSYEGVGVLGITNKHLYFSYGMKSFRIKYEKIVSIRSTGKGIILQKDGVRAMPQVFYINDDPWFIHNVLNNANNTAA